MDLALELTSVNPPPPPSPPPPPPPPPHWLGDDDCRGCCQLGLQTSHLPAFMMGDMCPQEIEVAEIPLVMLSQLRDYISGLQFGEFAESGSHACCTMSAEACTQCLALQTSQSTGGPYQVCLCMQSTSYHRAPDGP